MKITTYVLIFPPSSLRTQTTRETTQSCVAALRRSAAPPLLLRHPRCRRSSEGMKPSLLNTSVCWKTKTHLPFPPKTRNFFFTQIRTFILHAYMPLSRNPRVANRTTLSLSLSLTSHPRRRRLGSALSPQEEQEPRLVAVQEGVRSLHRQEGEVFFCFCFCFVRSIDRPATPRLVVRIIFLDGERVRSVWFCRRYPSSTLKPVLANLPQLLQHSSKSVSRLFFVTKGAVRWE